MIVSHKVHQQVIHKSGVYHMKSATATAVWWLVPNCHILKPWRNLALSV